MKRFAAPAFFLALAVAWTWPAVVTPMVTRQFDLYVTRWVAALGGWSLHSSHTAWPLGESLAGADSLLFLGLAALVPVRDVTLLALVTVLGPVASAWAAERCACRAFGVPEPASWVAGIAYGFSGIASSAFLEGHVYWLVNPWLPLLVGGLVVGGRGGGVVAGIGFSGAVFTSGYLALMAGIVTLVLVGIVPNRRATLVPFVALALPAGLAYVALLAQRPAGGTFSDSVPLSEGGTTLAGLAGWTPVADLGAHSIVAPVGWVGFWFLLFAPVLLRGHGRVWPLVILGWIGLVLAPGGAILGEVNGTPWLSPVAWLGRIPGAHWIHFPVRFAWLYALAAGLLAARGLAVLGGRWPVLGLFLATADAIVGTGAPFRSGRVLPEAPSAYAAAPDRAVLDVVPRPIDFVAFTADPFARGVICSAQAVHRSPIDRKSVV